MASGNNNLGKIWGKVVAQSWSDADYKSRVLDQPREVLAEEGFNIPEEVELSVSDGGPPKIHLVIPARPQNMDSTVTDESLETMAAGMGSCGCEYSASYPSSWGNR